MKLYHTIYADPPWKLTGGKNGKGGWSKTASPDVHYPLMKTDDIAALDVPSLCEEDAHLWLWVPNGMLEDGLWVMANWDFKYKNHVAWMKMGPPGLGQYIRNTHELCLFGVKGHLPYARTETGRRKQIKSSFAFPKGRHSAKPPPMRDMIRVVSPGPYIELFARERAEGWDAWGLEVQSDITLSSVV